MAGMSIPGTPFVVVGHNRAVAWGFTNAMVDDVDLFVERVDPRDTTRYLTPAGSEPFVVYHDTIRVKGSDDVVVQRVRWTRHGPVISDVTAGLGDAPVAMRWVAHDPAHTIGAVPAMNRARSAAEMREALRGFDDPHQNVVFADTAGDFGYQMTGHVPVRGARRPPPPFPVPGWTGEWDWNGRLPFEEHPAVQGASSPGYVATANNRQAAGDLGGLVTALWETPFRALRIEQMIETARAPLTTRDVHRMQLDVLDLHAVRYRDRAIDAAIAQGLDSIAKPLAAWDARATLESRSAAIYYAWYLNLRRARVRRSVRRRARADDAQRDRPRDRGARAAVARGRRGRVRAAERARHARWRCRRRRPHLGRAAQRHHRPCDGRGRSARPALRPRHPAASPRRLAHDGERVAVARHRAAVPPQYGPSQRHVVDMADVDGSGGFILPAGQSGIPFSRHYRDQHRAWVEGGLGGSRSIRPSSKLAPRRSLSSGRSSRILVRLGGQASGIRLQSRRLGGDFCGAVRRSAAMRA